MRIVTLTAHKIYGQKGKTDDVNENQVLRLLYPFNHLRELTVYMPIPQNGRTHSNNS